MNRITFIVILTIAVSGTDARKKEILKSASQLLEKDGDKYDVTSCQSIQLVYIKKLKYSNKKDQAIGCLLKALLSSNSNGRNWSYLGSLYADKGEKSKAATCFKQAAKLDGKVSQFVKEWNYIGPFVIGKSEVDGDPIEFWGGIENASKQMYDKKMVFYSELAPTGQVKWKTFAQSNAGEKIQIAPDIRWNDLISSLGSVAISEWQGWVIGEFAVNSKGDVSIQCLGVHTIFVDQVFIAADVYRREDFWFTLTLDPGIHQLFIRLRAKGTQVFQCSIKSFDDVTFLVHTPTMVPDIVDNALMGDVLSVPVTNLQGSKWLKNIRVKLADSGSQDIKVSQPKDHGHLSIAPGQTIPVIVNLELVRDEESDDPELCTDRRFRIQVSAASVKDSHTTQVTISCRKRHQSFVFSFMDHDGSVQEAAAIEPLESCPDGQCPVVLSLHGTGVSARNQADSYKRLEKDQWLFGLEKAWIFAPTRHGAHNWEGPGTLTAMTGLEKLCQLMSSVSWMHNKPSSGWVIFAGHSMGGHGAWHLATHYPDRALAVVSLAGWIKKEEYGDSNIFFRHDISTSHTDSAVKHILEACIAENDADRHISNIQGLPVLTRIGASDRTVHPYFVRRMNRLLKEQRTNVTYTELQGKEHWWWDTWKTNDGGAVNDPQLRDFVNSHATVSSFDSQSCNSDDPESSCTSTTAGRYSKSPGSLQNGNGEFTLTVINPALGEGLRGVRVIQQIVPFRTSTVKMILGEANATFTTNNVEKFSVTDLDYVPYRWKDVTMFQINGISIKRNDEIHPSTRKTAHFCLSEKEYWELCDVEAGRTDGERNPGNHGPARRVAEHRFIIVTGTVQEENSATFRSLSVYLANLFFLTSDAVAMVMEDRALTDDMAASYNLIIIGGPKENTWSQRFLDRVPFTVENHGLSLGRCHYTDPSTGAAFLAPHRDGGLGLVLLGNSIQGLEDAMRLASPTIPPMTRSPFSNMIPDYIVTGPDFKSKGPGGYLCAGFWGNRWDYRLEISSCVC